MSDILIRGMEMPIFEHQSWDIRHGDDGKWYIVDRNAETTDGEWHEIVPVPPHGRLIDADKLEKSFREDADEEWNRFAAPVNWADAFDDVANIVADAPTVIEAEEGK